MTSEPWSIASVLRWAADDFAGRGIGTARLDAELLLGHVLGLDRIRLIVEASRLLEPAELSAFRGLIQRRRRGEPIAYLRGEREFYGLSFRVDSRVLVPRPETELLVDCALDRTRSRNLYGQALDLCTGSGCVAIAFARLRRSWRIAAIDVYAEALDVARYNALRLGAAHNVHWCAGDLFEPFAGSDSRFDLVTANPPYVPSAELAGLPVDVRDFEPRAALDGGADGLDVVRRIVERAPAHLAPRGVLALEIGYGQAEAVAEMLVAGGFAAVERRRDYAGIERVVSGLRA